MSPSRSGEEESSDALLARYPRICSHIIAESLGYATPDVAATILKDARQGKPNYCEWVYSCFQGDAKRVVSDSIRHRHNHKGYMASYELALEIVQRQLQTGQGPMFGSWF